MGQRVPQLPQFIGSLRVSISQPSVVVLLQFAKPARHEPRPQEPFVQVGDAFANLHVLLHRPQCVVLLSRLVSQPFSGVLSQFWFGAVHDTSRHVPSRHCVFALALAQAIPQPPQWARVLLKFASQPSIATPLQSPKPGTHERPQWPEVHTGSAFALAGHTAPQAPQLVGSVAVNASQPASTPKASARSSEGAASPTVAASLMLASLIDTSGADVTTSVTTAAPSAHTQGP